MSGSDDANVRLWKTDASAPLRIMSGREQRALQYRKALRKRFGHMPAVAEIERAQHLPKLVRVVSKQRKFMNDAAKRKAANVAAHSREPTEEELRKTKTTLKEKGVAEELE